MKRFWKDVTVENGQVALDGKPVRFLAIIM